MTSRGGLRGGIYLQRFRNPGLGGIIDLGLPDTPTAALPQLAQTEAQILLVGIIFDLPRKNPSVCTDRAKSNPTVIYKTFRF